MSIASQPLTGIIKDSKDNPIIGASVYFLNTSIGTSTDDNGAFILIRKNNETNLVISYTGYSADTIQIPLKQSFLKLQLQEKNILNEVTIKSSRDAHSFSLLNPLNIESLTSKEFKKAPCCSLAESFQTSNTVDVSYSNAVSGAKEIQFLGLRGIYSQLLIENTMYFDGILASQGFDFIPGTWLDNVNLLKGASTAIHGAQSMTGAINVALKNPESDHRLFTNLYSDYHKRFEFNQHLNKSWSASKHSGIYIHQSHHAGSRDHNNDGFYDDPRTNQTALLIRNTFLGNKFEGKINAYGLLNHKSGGQITNINPYRFNQKIDHFVITGNLGFVGFANPDRSIGSLWEVAVSNINAYYGKPEYTFKAKETKLLSQIFYAEYFQEAKHKITLGIANSLNNASEISKVKFSDTKNYYLYTMSAFFDYDFATKKIEDSDLKRWIITLSNRVDLVNGDKLIYTPRFSTRYNLNPEWTIRASAGSGYRQPRYYSDNLSLFFINYERKNIAKTEFERSINFGTNLVGKPHLFKKNIECNIDVYHTKFINQLVFDYEDQSNTYPKLNSYFSKNKSSTTALGITVSYPVFKFIELKLGTKYIDNITGYANGNRQTPFVPKWRALAVVDFNSNNKKWMINLTSQFVGKMRIPNKASTTHNHTSTYSDEFILLQSNITYKLKNWEFYTGCENIGNKTQHHAIISADAPFSNDFNANEIYAPINGIKPYIGLRYFYK